MILAAIALVVTAQDRVETARANRLEPLTVHCRKLGFEALPTRLYLRAFKKERELEAWGYLPKVGRYVLVKAYGIAGMSGILGPKRAEGDLQVPEGFYRVNALNPRSRFHLSLRIDYPNASDRILSDRESPGGDIYIHGGRASIGCLAMTDPAIEEIYLLALAAKAKGIPVHIFPARLGDVSLKRLLLQAPEHGALWRSLKPMYDGFEKDGLLRGFRVLRTGLYRVSPSKLPQ